MLFGATGGTISYFISSTGGPSEILPRALFGVLLTAFIGVGIYTVLVPVCALFGPNRHLGWIGLPPFVLRLGIVSIGTFLLFFIIGAIIAMLFGQK